MKKINYLGLGMILLAGAALVLPPATSASRPAEEAKQEDVGPAPQFEKDRVVRYDQPDVLRADEPDVGLRPALTVFAAQIGIPSVVPAVA